MFDSKPLEKTNVAARMCTKSQQPGHILLVEPFNGGSHKQLVDLLCKEVPGIVPVTTPGKKWHWKARVSALHMSQIIPPSLHYRILFASSVLNLCELVSLRPDLAPLKKVLYFHENQLVYPKQKENDRDYQYGYNNITSCMVADTILFNSKYNMDSFLHKVDAYLNKIPYEKPKGVAEQIRRKCHVLNFPIVFPNVKDIKDSITPNEIVDTDIVNKNPSANDISDSNLADDVFSCDTQNESLTDNSIEIRDRNLSSAGQMEDGSASKRACLEGNKMTHQPHRKLKPLHIVWPHRWEHDKNPAMFFSVINRLLEVGCDFRLSVLGERYSEIPAVFSESKPKLASKIEHWGYVESKLKYYQILYQADCVVSTADHEFFGVAMLEAVHLGCFPLCPNRLVYPEIFPKECLYNTETQLYKRLREFCRKPYLVRQNAVKDVFTTQKHSCIKDLENHVGNHTELQNDWGNGFPDLKNVSLFIKPYVVDTEQYSWDRLKPHFMKYLTVEENNT